jgi:hypothetical protein
MGHVSFWSLLSICQYVVTGVELGHKQRSYNIFFSEFVCVILCVGCNAMLLCV